MRKDFVVQFQNWPVYLAFLLYAKKTPVNLQLRPVDFQRGIELNQKFIALNS
jgi:hypothetical protein